MATDKLIVDILETDVIPMLKSHTDKDRGIALAKIVKNHITTQRRIGVSYKHVKGALVYKSHFKAYGWSEDPNHKYGHNKPFGI